MLKLLLTRFKLANLYVHSSTPNNQTTFAFALSNCNGNFYVCAYLITHFCVLLTGCSINQFMCSCKWLTVHILTISSCNLAVRPELVLKYISVSRSQLREKKPREVFLCSQGHCHDETGKGLPQTIATMLEAQNHLVCHCML